MSPFPFFGGGWHLESSLTNGSIYLVWSAYLQTLPQKNKGKKTQLTSVIPRLPALLNGQSFDGCCWWVCFLFCFVLF
jgi:hypothetical protein